MNIVIGTAQFGMDYGVSNKAGKTTKKQVTDILKYAYQYGVTMLDTASLYGGAENAIGDFIYNEPSNIKWDIVTKTQKFISESIDKKQIDELVQNFHLSRNKLNQKMIYGLLLHSCDNLFIPGGGKLIQVMRELKDEGLVKKIGVSAYSAKQIDDVIDNYSIDLIQLPVNILDQRLVKGGQLKKLKQHGVEIHARSVFLQGLLLMELEQIPAWFSPIRPILNNVRQEAKAQNVSLLQLALRFVLSIEEIDKVVIGVNNVSQLAEVIAATSDDINIYDYESMSVKEERFLNPSNWNL